MFFMCFQFKMFTLTKKVLSDFLQKKYMIKEIFLSNKKIYQLKKFNRKYFLTSKKFSNTKLTENKVEH